MLKKTIKQCLYGAKVRIQQLRRKKKLQRALVLVLLVTGINLLTAACGQNETLTLKEAKTSAEEAFSSDAPAEKATDAERTTDAEKSADSEAEGALEFLYVYVCGAVERPGVYSFPEGARVCDAIAAAGGLTLEGDETCVNQALKLSDQDQIYIRTLEEKAPESEETGSVPRAGVSSAAGEPGETGPSGTARINLNTATRDELLSLSGIGETKAAAILAYRQEHGFFAKPEDLKKVSGIGDATYEKLKDRITAQ